MARSSLKELAAHSSSFMDLVNNYSDVLQEKLADQAVGKVVDLIGKGAQLPDDVSNQFVFWVKALARTVAPHATAKLEQGVDKVADAVTSNLLRGAAKGRILSVGKQGYKLMKLAEVMGLEPEKSSARLVHADLRYEEAKQAYAWQGTLIRAELKDASERAPSVFYFPGLKCSVCSNPSFSVTARTVRGFYGPPTKFGGRD